MKTSHNVTDHLRNLFLECVDTYRKGHEEYAHSNLTPFSNFERGGSRVGISREQALWVLAGKHIDGITAYLRDGVVKQRDSIRGRIVDLVVYLGILSAMLEENEAYSSLTSTGVYGSTEGLWGTSESDPTQEALNGDEDELETSTRPEYETNDPSGLTNTVIEDYLQALEEIFEPLPGYCYTLVER